MNDMLRNEQEKKALEFLNAMGISRLFSDIAKAGVDKLSKFFADLYEYPSLEEYIKRFEAEKQALVYYVTSESFLWGDCFSLLYVSRYEEDWAIQFPIPVIGKRQYIVQAWVWNRSEEWRSEFGSAVVESEYGLLSRVC